MEHFHQSLSVAASPASVWSALATISGLRAWWTEDCNGMADTGGAIRFGFGLAHKEMRVERFEPDREVSWVCTRACIDLPSLNRKDEWIGTEMVFRLSGEGGGRTRIDFEHIGLVPPLECYGMCVKGWQYYLGSLKQYLETGKGTPHLADGTQSQCQERAAA